MWIKTAIIAVILIIGLGAGYYFGMGKNSEDRSQKIEAEASGKNQRAAIDEAIRVYKERIAANPKDAEAVSRLADIYFESGKFEEAISEYKKAIKLNPKDVDSINDLGLAYLNLGKMDDAISELIKGTKIDPMYQRIWLSLGFAYISKDNKIEARKAWQRAAAMDPASPVGKEANKFLERFK
ncbi:MAG: tetratricopeptide repeat protein [Nitrospirae bacterium]|nr:tetratricopeptide repeat protein [Nitrospirota bacterium]